MNEIVQMLLTAKEDTAWYGKHLDEFKKKFDKQFVAFRHKKIIAADPDLKTLMGKLGKKGVDTNDVFVEFVSKIPRIL